MSKSRESLLAALAELEREQSDRLTLRGLYERAGVSRATLNRHPEILSKFRQMQLARSADDVRGSAVKERPSEDKRAETKREMRRAIDDWANLVQVLQIRNNALEDELRALKPQVLKVIPFRKKASD
jgi:hypothetical protein